MVKSVNVLTIPHNLQRYDTLGDWFTENGVLHIHVSRLRDWRSELAIAVHELIEAVMCDQAGITAEMVDEFDFEFVWRQESGEIPPEAEPGAAPGCPYASQHAVATEVERLLVELLGLKWDPHEQTCQEALDEAKPEGSVREGAVEGDPEIQGAEGCGSAEGARQSPAGEEG